MLHLQGRNPPTSASGKETTLCVRRYIFCTDCTRTSLNIVAEFVTLARDLLSLMIEQDSDMDSQHFYRR